MLWAGPCTNDYLPKVNYRLKVNSTYEYLEIVSRYNSLQSTIHFSHLYMIRPIVRTQVLFRVLSQLTVTEFVDMHNFVIIHHSIATCRYAYITFSEYMMLFFNYYFMEE